MSNNVQVANICLFNPIPENKILTNIFEFTVNAPSASILADFL